MKSKKYFIATRCLGVMNNNLSKCIPYPLSPSGTNNKSPTAPGQIPRFVTYCCRYWAHHLKEVEDISISGDLVSELDTFLNENLFRWLVCLDSTESLDAGVIKAVKDASERIKDNNLELSKRILRAHTFANIMSSSILKLCFNLYEKISQRPSIRQKMFGGKDN
ncbi:WD40 domain containing protein [Pyrrhoderma noxium]|uniref:WD40 domain containing protein n=1 Tax=Pyrrhoderma noxium TaxID=2282107 RepID=A0A286UPC8_9AGAM|nr:WD40 domain containing protein [Pyrrhoderma noxium]